jgi:hypothetical protein
MIGAEIVKGCVAGALLAMGWRVLESLTIIIVLLEGLNQY